MTNSPSVEHTQNEQHTAEVSKVITMDTKVTFEVTNSNIWLNHLATTTIIQVCFNMRAEGTGPTTVDVTPACKPVGGHQLVDVNRRQKKVDRQLSSS